MNTQLRTTIAKVQSPEVSGRGLGHAPRSTLYASLAFTLVELLVVIAILAILMGIIVPSYFSIREKAQYTKAKTTTKNLETAFKNYLDNYRTWPGALSAGAAHEIKDNVFRLLRERVDDANNKDGLPFYEFETTNSADGALDAWANPSEPDSSNTYYWVQVDHDYDNKITLEADMGGQTISRTVIVWSFGADRTKNTSDDVKSWE